MYNTYKLAMINFKLTFMPITIYHAFSLILDIWFGQKILWFCCWLKL